jgi:uncharacterized protein YacL
MFLVLRAAVVLVFAISGYYVGLGYGLPVQGSLIGFVFGILAIVVEQVFKRVSLGSIIGGVIGLSIGLLSANLLLLPLRSVVSEGFQIVSFLISALLGYSGLLLGARKGENMSVSTLVRAIRGHGMEENQKLLDTSVIIDGRIADVCETGFLEGVFIVPQFILQELQHIADSPDSLKRARGRRGLDILHRMQKMAQITVKIVEEDFPKIKEVDSKLVALAKALNAKIVTNDFNLNKVAELQGVSVLNINELANAIKPVVMPGETIRVFIIKEGKEYNQGVAYLEDGTMVVVDNGRKLIGKNIDVTVTSVLQTTAGRMIFTKTKEDYEREELRAVK